MTAVDHEEAPRYIGGRPYEIQLGVKFKPFKGVRNFYRTPEGYRMPYIEENYEYGTALRKPVKLHGMEGFIDIITDEPFGMIAVMCHNPVETPLGETYFESIYSGRGKEEFLQEPCIFRFSFLLRNPSDYTKLLNTYADVRIGKTDYILAWNYSRPVTRRVFQALNGGEQGWLSEKNLFNAIPKDATVDIGDIEDEEVPSKDDLGRITCVWLPPKLKLLRTPEFTFHRIDHRDDQEVNSAPPTPEKERVPVLV